MQQQLDPDTIPLFADLTAEERLRIAPLLRRKLFPASTAIIAAEHPGQEVYFILEGTVKVSVDQSDGSSLILAILGPGSVVGEMGVIQRGHRSATVVTMERSSVAWMYRDDFERCLRDYPDIGVRLAAIIAQRLRLANERLLSFITEDVDQRIARMLLSFAIEHGARRDDGSIHIPIRLTQTDLAEYVGASRISVNRAVSALRDARLISVDRRYQCTILDQHGLERRCG
jgi:CRP/FNR family cyclic AMP-dependent transcriptional regulator